MSASQGCPCAVLGACGLAAARGSAHTCSVWLGSGQGWSAVTSSGRSAHDAQPGKCLTCRASTQDRLLGCSWLQLPHILC